MLNVGIKQRPPPARRLLLSILLLVSPALAALQVNLSDTASIKAAASTVAYDLMTYYKGNLSGWIPGILPGPPPYYWWEGGALWGTMMDYWHYTGDETYNDVVMQGMQFQTGAPNNAYMPANWSLTMGNDDQGFWGMSAMLAAELKFPNPPADQPQWLALAQAVFNTQASRIDDTCGGGLRWQVFSYNTGYDYKNSIANGIFFNLGARLARYTANDTYAQYAVKAWDWVQSVGFMDNQYNIYDGAHVEEQCGDVFKAQFSYNAAVFLQGAAFMYNYTNGSAEWEDRTRGLLNRTIEVFFSNHSTVTEISCELANMITCTNDMLSFKGYLHRWLASATQVAPFIYDTVKAQLLASTTMAVRSCAGGAEGRQCGFRWNTGTWDGNTGAGQEMSVVAALSSLLISEPHTNAPVTTAEGGTSVGDAAAGSGTSGAVKDIVATRRTTGGDRAGAGVLTILVLVGMLATTAWLCGDWGELKPAQAPRREKGRGASTSATKAIGVGMGMALARMARMGVAKMGIGVRENGAVPSPRREMMGKKGTDGDRKYYN